MLPFGLIPWTVMCLVLRSSTRECGCHRFPAEVHQSLSDPQNAFERGVPINRSGPRGFQRSIRKATVAQVSSFTAQPQAPAHCGELSKEHGAAVMMV
jgi:hypothetical protein